MDPRDPRLPTRRHSVRGLMTDGQCGWLSVGISRKLYRCQQCGADLFVGVEHVILRRLDVQSRYTHHHLHRQCWEVRLRPTMTRLEILDASQTTRQEMNRRARRKRNRQRRRQ